MSPSALENKQSWGGGIQPRRQASKCKTPEGVGRLLDKEEEDSL